MARLGLLGVADLEAGFRDPSPVVRRRVCELAGTLPGAGTEPRLLALLSEGLADPAASVVEAACFALGEAGGALGEAAGGALAGAAGGTGTALGEAFPLDALAGVTNAHPDPLCREAAVAALGAAGDRRGLPAILAATTDKPAIRRRAVLALAAFDGPEVDEALARARDDRDWQVRQAAEDLS